MKHEMYADNKPSSRNLEIITINFTGYYARLLQILVFRQAGIDIIKILAGLGISIIEGERANCSRSRSPQDLERYYNYY